MEILRYNLTISHQKGTKTLEISPLSGSLTRMRTWWISRWCLFLPTSRYRIKYAHYLHVLRICTVYKLMPMSLSLDRSRESKENFLNVLISVSNRVYLTSCQGDVFLHKVFILNFTKYAKFVITLQRRIFSHFSFVFYRVLLDFMNISTSLLDLQVSSTFT